MKKRLLSIALCLAMLLTCLPAVAAAEQAPAPDRPDRGVTPWTDLSEDQIVVGGVVLNKGICTPIPVKSAIRRRRAAATPCGAARTTS